MSKDLAQFDSLKADITLFVAPVTGLKVSDFKSSAEAIEAGKQIKSLMKQVEDKRKGLVGPLNDQVKLINDYAKNIREPLERAESHVKTELNLFAVEQERIRQEELRRAEEDRREQERKAEEDRQRIAAEIEARKQAELAALHESREEAADIFGSATPVSVEQVQAIEQAAEREKVEAQAVLDREAAIRDAQARATEWDINQNRIKNTAKRWKVEVVDINLVPKEYVIMTLNSAMALAAARGGNTNIPGLKFSQEVSVSIGSAYVPRKALGE